MMKLGLAVVVIVGAAACGSAANTTDVAQAQDNLETATCTEATRPGIWANAFSQPIKPPRYGAGLDLAVTDDYSMMTQESMQQALCAGTVVPDTEDPPSEEVTIQWGEGKTGPVAASFDKQTHKLAFIAYQQGYTGSIEFKSRPGSRFGSHAYSATPGKPILRDGAAFEIDWSNTAVRDEKGTELFDALMFTFAPNLPGESTNCRTTAHCLLVSPPGGEAYFGARDVHFYLHFPAAADGQPTGSTPDYFYVIPSPLGFTPPPPPPSP